jgi:peroxiredoxin
LRPCIAPRPSSSRAGGPGAPERRATRHPSSPSTTPTASRFPLAPCWRKGRWSYRSIAASGALIAISSSRRSKRRGRKSRRGATLVAVSPQTAPNSRKSQRDNKLGFPILSDVNSEVADAFGIRFALPDYLVELYKSFKNDLPGFNNDPSWVLPMPARYVIGQDGIIAYAEVNPDYTHRPDPSELLPVLDRLRTKTAA